MIQRELNVVDVQGDLKGVEVEMSIDEAAAHLIMERLIRLYSDTVLAFVREISTNAFDATVEAAPDKAAVLAGTADRPIHVALPSRLAPMFIVRDHGIGMTYDDIVNVYSRYGASTKRESNDYNGALGFGCKAPLAYTPTFSVQSVRNGHRVTVQVGRTPKGGGKMTIVEGGPDNPCPTTEPNGTTVMIPVGAEDIGRVETTSRDFFRFWKAGTVLVNGEQPEHIKPLLRLNDTMAVIESDSDYIVMANVAYPVRLTNDLSHGYSLMAEVETGSVEFTPSREGLEQTPYTRQRLSKVAQDFTEAIEGAIQRKISEAKTREDAMASMIHWRAALPRSARSKDDIYVWNRQVLPAKWDASRQIGQDWPFVVASAASYVGGRSRMTDNLGAETFGRDVFVTGFGGTKFTLNHKRRLEMWKAAHQDVKLDHSGQYIMVRDDEIPRNVRIWIDPKRIVTWKHIKANFKLPRHSAPSYTSRKALMGSYEDVWTEAGMIGETMANDIRQDKTIYYFTTNDHYSHQIIPIVKLVAKEYTIVKLSMNRIDKFVRDFPAAKKLSTAAEAAYAAWAPTITQDVKDAYAFQAEISAYGAPGAILRKLDPARVDDPAIKQGIKLAKIDLTSAVERDRLFRALVGKYALSGGKTMKDPMESYPLITGRHMPIHAHLYLYLNAAYAAKTTP